MRAHRNARTSHGCCAKADAALGYQHESFWPDLDDVAHVLGAGLAFLTLRPCVLASATTNRLRTRLSDLKIIATSPPRCCDSRESVRMAGR